MTPPENVDRERLEELEISRILFGLSSDEEAEQARLVELSPVDMVGAYDELIALLDVVWTDPRSMSLPEHLREAIRQSALRELAIPPVSAAASTEAANPRKSRVALTWLPWTMALVCVTLLVADLMFNAIGRLPRHIAQDVVRQRTELIETGGDLIQVAWSDGPTPMAGAQGDVVWSPSRQKGFMRFRGLKANSPDIEQYQLWIFDRNQSEATPVDGGVFDIRSNGEAIVPIQAKLHVREAYLFAVTIEKPGGVVVSSRERLPLLAAVK